MNKTPVQAPPPLVIWASMWGVGVAFGIALIGHDLLVPTRTPLGRDFMNLWVAGRMVLEGQTPAIFDYLAFQARVLELLDADTTNYSYPPHALFMAVPFALLPYHPALALWTIGGAALFAWAARPFVPFPAWLAVLTPAAFVNIWNGHYGFVFGALWLLFFRNLATRPVRGGLCVAALTFKPHMGVLIAFAALRDRRVVLTAIAGTIALAAGAALIFGGWPEFFGRTVPLQAEIMSRGNEFFFARLMPTAFIAYGTGSAGWVAQAIFTAATAWLVLRSRTVDPFALATASFLIVPYAFNYDMTVASLGFAILLHRDWYRLGAAERIVGILAFLSPALTFFAGWAVPVILLAGLWLQLRCEPREDLTSDSAIGREKASH